MTRDSIKAMARHVWTGHQLVRNRELIHPERDWLIGLGSGVVIAMVIIGWSAQLYMTYRDNPQVIVDPAQADMVIYRAPLVESARVTLLERRLAAAALLSGQSPVVVPVSPVEPLATTTVPVVELEITTIPTSTTSEISEVLEPSEEPENPSSVF